MTISKTQRNRKFDRNFANWVQNESFLSLFCIALGVFIKRNMVLHGKCHDKDFHLTNNSTGTHALTSDSNYTLNSFPHNPDF